MIGNVTRFEYISVNIQRLGTIVRSNDVLLALEEDLVYEGCVLVTEAKTLAQRQMCPRMGRKGGQYRRREAQEPVISTAKVVNSLPLVSQNNNSRGPPTCCTSHRRDEGTGEPKQIVGAVLQFVQNEDLIRLARPNWRDTRFSNAVQYGIIGNYGCKEPSCHAVKRVNVAGRVFIQSASSLDLKAFGVGDDGYGSVWIRSDDGFGCGSLSCTRSRGNNNVLSA
jgi:hypothetical protein